MNTRYRHTEYTISEKEARKQRREELKQLRAEIEDLLAQEKEIREAPLNLTHWKYEPVNPGEPGYEDLSPPTLTQMMCVNGHELSKRLSKNLMIDPWSVLIPKTGTP